MDARSRRHFRHVEAKEERIVIERRGGQWHVKAHTVSLTVDWSDDDVVIIRQGKKEAAAPLVGDRRELFARRLERNLVQAALDLFREAMSELAEAPAPDHEPVDDLAARRSRLRGEQHQ
jgi:hypothetical protein